MTDISATERKSALLKKYSPEFLLRGLDWIATPYENVALVLRMRLGLIDNRIFTLAAIAEIMSVSRERVRTIELKGVCMLEDWCNRTSQ